jgi:WD40 repeat protein/transcriptional regulator with XRE-family HTH domain
MTLSSISPHSFTSFGDLLKYLRRRQRLTQLELSIAVGYSESQITRLEKNQRLPDLAAVKALFVPALHLENEPELTKHFLELAESARQEDAPAPGVAPYKGLLFFDESDADLFFGREALSAHLTRDVIDLAADSSSRFLAVVGASGSGKSSLVRAGLAVALKRAGWDTRVFTPTANPLKVLAANVLAAREQNSERVLILVDQFEEVFTLCHDEMERITFIEQLLSLAQDKTKNTTVVIALRADFYPHCAQYPSLRQAVAAEQEYIGQMTTEALRRAIEEPARHGGWEFEPGLVNVLLQDIGAHGSQEPEPGALPLLSHALLATWERRRGRVFTLDGYHASGGVRSAIAETAESVFTDQLNGAQQELVRDVFLRLTELGEGTEDTRRRATLNELVRKSVEATQLRVVLNTLAEARLITLNEDSAEVAHEALIREWQRLRDWLNEDREGLKLHRHLTENVREWESRGRDPSELYRGARLAHAREWMETYGDRLNQSERDFLAASVEQEQHEALERGAQRERELVAAQKLAETEKARVEEQAHSIKQLRRRAVYLVVVLVVAVISAVFAGILANQNSRLASTNASIAQMAQIEAAARTTAEANAIHESNKAKQQALIASVRELAGNANLNLTVDPERSILLALQAVALTDAFGQPPLLEAQDALHRAVQTSRVQLTLQGHTRELMGIAYSPDGVRLATISDDGTVRIWDATTGEEVQKIPVTITVPNLYRVLSFSPDGKQLAANDGQQAKVWDAASGQELLTLSGHTDEVLAVIFSPTNSTRIATASADGVIKIWDAVSGQELLALSDPVPSNPSQLQRMTLAFSNDGARLAAGRNITATVWDLTSSQILRTVSDSALVNINSVAFSQDGNRLALGSSNTTWGLWDISTGQNLRTGFGHSSILSHVTFDSAGKRLATTSEDGTAKVWDAATGRELLTLAGHTSGIESVAFSPDGRRLATAGRDTTVKVWDISPLGGGEWFNLTGHSQRIWGLAYSPDGTRIATGSRDKTVKLWEAKTGEELFTLSGFTFEASRVAFSPNGTQLLVNRGIQNEFDATLWDLATRNVLLTFPHNALVFGVAFSPDGKYIGTSTFDGAAKIWDAETGNLIHDLSGNTNTIQRVAFNPDGTRFATASEDGTAKVWDVVTGKTLLTLSGHTSVVWGAIFSPDNSLIATVGNDGTAKLWDSATGQELFTFTGHNGPILGVAFSSDSQFLATASTDRTAKVWDVSAGVGAQPLTLHGHTGPILDVTFSPDGTRLVTASGDGTARVYALNFEDLVAIAKSRLTRNLTEQECQQYLHMEACPTKP